MNSSDNVPFDYYADAMKALDCGDHNTAATLCKTAAEGFEKTGASHEASVAYHLLGGVSYKSGALKDAKSWYLKSLALITPSDDAWAIEYARTCNNLAAVMNATGDYAAAKDWLMKSMDIKERLQDKAGLVAAYHQMGIVEQTQGNLDEARRWYSKALQLEKEVGDITYTVATVRCLASLAGDDSDPRSVDKLYRIATDAIGKTGDATLAASSAEQARNEYDFRASTEFYRKAYEMATLDRSKGTTDQRGRVQ